MKAVLAKAKVVRQGLARLRIEYAYSPMGRGLVEAGHCTGSREYAIGVDPFKGWTKGLRGAAFHDIGWGCDDVAAFRGIGVRIEDDVVVTKDGCENLNTAIPKRPEEVEAWVRGA